MTNPNRKPGAFGRRAPKCAAALDLGPLLTGTIPAHPAAADYLAKLNGGWLVLGNDRAGDCNSVAWANTRRLVTGTLTTEKYPTQAMVWEFYRTQNPGFDPNGSSGTNGPGSDQDQGMEIQTGLEYLHAHGGPDGVKPVAFARVNPQSPDQVKAAIAIFGSVWTGITVLAVNEDEFSEGKPWNYQSRSPQVGGHAIVTGGYGKAGKGALGGDERFVTWGQETSFTDTFWKHEAEECWAVIWPEHLGSKAFEQGINRTLLAADYHALTGKTLPA